MLTTYPYNHVGSKKECFHIQITLNGFRLLVGVGTLKNVSFTFENTAYSRFAIHQDLKSRWQAGEMLDLNPGPWDHVTTEPPPFLLIRAQLVLVGDKYQRSKKSQATVHTLKVMTPRLFRGIRPSDIANNFHAIKLMFKHPQIYDIIDICKHFR
jgi:hypothetical protein